MDLRHLRRIADSWARPSSIPASGPPRRKCRAQAYGSALDLRRRQGIVAWPAPKPRSASSAAMKSTTASPITALRLPLFLRADAYPSEAERITAMSPGAALGDLPAQRFHWRRLPPRPGSIMCAPTSALRRRAPTGATYDLEKALDRLADIVREHSDMETIYKA